MKECVLCNIIKNGDNNNEKEKNIVLYDDEFILISQAIGSPVRGYIMIIPKKHINGFAELSLEEFKYVESVIKVIKDFYQKHFHVNSILLEHGSTKNGRHPQSIVHAHLHLIPFNFNEEIENELVQELKLKPIKSFEDIKINEKLDYWMYCDKKDKFYTSSNVLEAPRSIFMNLIAKQKELQLPYEWRNSVTPKEYINEMVDLFNTNKEALQNISIINNANNI